VNFKFWIALILALGLDALDYLVVGLFPFAGDIVDVLGIIMLYPFIGVYAFIGVLELVPVIGDLLPTFTGAVLLSRSRFMKKMLEEAP